MKYSLQQTTVLKKIQALYLRLLIFPLFFYGVNFVPVRTMIMDWLKMNLSSNYNQFEYIR